MEVPFNVYAMAKVSDFKFGTQLGFAQPHHKITPRIKAALGLVFGITQYMGFPFNISATSEVGDFKFGMLLEFAKAHRNIRKKSGHVR